MKYDDVTIWILQKMYRNKIIGGKHISLQNLKTGLPSHIRGDADKKLKKLIKANLVLQHPTNYRMQYNLNHEKIEVIMKILGIESD